MRSMISRNVRKLFILVCALLPLCVFGFAVEKITNGEGNTIKKVNDDFCIRGEFYGEEFAVNPWLNEEDNKYYFFLPEYLQTEVDFGDVPNMVEYKQIILSDIPCVSIQTESGTLDAIRASKDNQENIEMLLLTKEDRDIGGVLQGTIKARGNASFLAPRYKKSYTIELEEAIEMCDMSEGKEWLLLAHYYDDTHLRDYMTFDLARQLGMNYVPDGKFVNLYVNGDFQGIYFLCEKIGISSERLNIRNLEEINQEKLPNEVLKEYPYAMDGIRGGQNVIIEKGYIANDATTDITGGYLLELEWVKERYDEENSGFTSANNQSVVIKSPKYATYGQVSYIKSRYQLFEDALDKSIETGTEEYLQYIDLDSFVNKYLIEEISKNMDANFSSQFLYKDSDLTDGKFYAGPVWDYDRAYENKVDDEDNKGADKFWVNEGRLGFSFWKKLYSTSIFNERAKEIYNMKAAPVLQQYLDTDIWSWEREIHDSIIADMFRYRGEYEIEMNEEERLSQEMNHLVEFLSERKVFLDTEWGDYE